MDSGIQVPAALVHLDVCVSLSFFSKKLLILSGQNVIPVCPTCCDLLVEGYGKVLD